MLLPAWVPGMEVMGNGVYIGPAYASKATRNGVRVGDLRDLSMWGQPWTTLDNICLFAALPLTVYLLLAWL
jgi:hypothetical protein